jgi:hypothetical protein
LEDTSAADILRELLTKRATGRLRAQSPVARRTLYFDRGRLVFASSTASAEQLGEVLVDQGKLKPEALRDALKDVTPDRKLGSILVERGYVEASDLVAGLREQVKRIVLQLFEEDEGLFGFQPSETRNDSIINLNLRTEEMLGESVGKVSNPRSLVRSLGSMDGRLELNGHFQAAGKLAPTEPYKLLLSFMHHSRMTVRELCSRSSLPAIDTCRFLTLLIALGYVEKSLPN